MTGRSIPRRKFLAGGAAIAAGVGLTSCTDEAEQRPAAASSTAPPDLSSWRGVRGEFALDPDLAHFAAFTIASHPRSVRAAIEKWRDALDEDAPAVVVDESEYEEKVRAAAALYLNVVPDEIALTDSTTMGLGLTYGGLRLEPDDHVLTSTHDFYSTHESLRLAARRSGATVERIPLYDDPAAASAGEMVARVKAALRPTTKLVALTWVHSSTGVKIPVRAIADMLDRTTRERVLFCLDAVHGLAAENTLPVELGCDVFISGTHKWLFGPRGTGIVWARRSAWDALSPIIPTFSGPSIGGWLFGEQAPPIFGLDATPGGYHSFEHRWALSDAFDFHSRIGRLRVAERTRELAAQLKEGLAALSGIRLVTPRDPEVSAGIVCCDVAGFEPAAVTGVLRREHGIVASVTPYREQYVRFGPSIVNTPEEVDAAVRAVAKFT